MGGGQLSPPWKERNRNTCPVSPSPGALLAAQPFPGPVVSDSKLEFLSQELKFALGVGGNHRPPDGERAPWSHPCTVRV